MERVDAEMHGWPAAPFSTKAETDANYKRMLDVALDPANDGAVRVGRRQSQPVRGGLGRHPGRAPPAPRHRVEIEMLEGHGAGRGRGGRRPRSAGLLLYAPIVGRGDLESAIAYLVRRLDENSGPDNFLTHSVLPAAGSPAWKAEADRFRQLGRGRATTSRRADPPDPGPGSRDRPGRGRRRLRQRAGHRLLHRRQPATGSPGTSAVRALDRAARVPAGGRWADRRRARPPEIGIDPSAPGPSRPTAGARPTGPMVERAVAAARAGRAGVGGATPARAAAGPARGGGRRPGPRPGAICWRSWPSTPAKTIREGDPEVSEAIDFAAYYAEHIPTRTVSGPTAPSWWRRRGTSLCPSRPAASSAALAAGNAVILKPAPEAVAVAGELAEALWEGGVPRSVLQFVPCVDGDASRC